MSFEIFDALESRVEKAISTVVNLQQEVEGLKAKNIQLENETKKFRMQSEELTNQLESTVKQYSGMEAENVSLKHDLQDWRDKLKSLLNKMSEIA